MFKVDRENKTMSLDNMKTRIMIAGGTQDGRNVKGKLKSMQSALKNSYQAEWITFNKKKCRCLINPEKLSTDYEQKIISIENKYHMKSGDVFYWNRTHKHWIVYSEYEEEEAYFRARIRECEYQIETDKDKYWIYLRGPVETALVWRQKHSLEFNDLNYSLELYITKNEDTDEFFTRHRIVKFDGHNWKVAAVDRYSQAGIIQVFLEETADNDMLDEMIVPEIVEPDTSLPYIEGPQFVQPYDTDISYSIENIDGGEFVVNSSKVKITNSDSTSCTLNILTGRSGEFDLIYKVIGQDDIVLHVTIESF